MEFWNCPTQKGLSRLSKEQLLERLAKLPFEEQNPVLAEWEWHQARRPYYDLYPGVISLLEKVDLSDISVCSVKPPLPQLVVRLPNVQHGLSFETLGNQRSLRSVFFADSIMDGRPTTIASIDVGETDDKGFPIVLYRWWCRDNDASIQEILSEIEPATNPVLTTSEFLFRVTKMLASICLLGDDPDLIEPDVLAKDRVKFSESGDIKYVERAHQRGKRAWTIGKKIEKEPHYRRSHLAKFWVGPGRTVPILRLRRGGIIKRKKVVEIPTGYLDDPLVLPA